MRVPGFLDGPFDLMSDPIGTYLKMFAAGALLAVGGLVLYTQYGSDSPARRAAEAETSADSGLVTVYKSPTCACCRDWADHLRRNGFEVVVRDSDDLSAVKDRLGVPTGLRSCHTAVVGSYVVEGHVPARDVERMLASESEIAGVAVPGMPVGSPGIERGERVDPYAVLAFNDRGQTQVVARYGSE